MHPLWRLVAQRVALGLLVLLLVSVVIFGAVQLLPGDIATEILGQMATPESVAALQLELGLDRPAVLRYVDWLGGLLRGDLGRSLANRQLISEMIGDRLWNTFFLAIYAATLAIPTALLLGITAALFRNSAFDRSVSVATLSAISLPEFFVGYLLVFLLAQGGLFPSMARVTAEMPLTERLYVSFLPALTLTLGITAHMMRMTRAAIVNVLSAAYVEMARLKGLPRWRVVVRHALPNALAPIINVVAINLAYLITGVVVVEVVFVYPGLGQLMVDSVSKRDITVVQTVSLIFAAVYVTLNLTADVLSTLVNPRLLHRR